MKLDLKLFEEIIVWGASSSGLRVLDNLLFRGVEKNKIRFVDSRHVELQDLREFKVESPTILSMLNPKGKLLLIGSTIGYEIQELVPENWVEHTLYIHELIFSRKISSHYSKEFMAVFSEVSTETNMDIEEAYLLWTLVQSVTNVSGLIIEVGVYKGGSLRIISEAANRFSPEKKVIGFDTFEGVPVTNSVLDSNLGTYLSDTSIAQARQRVSHLTNVEVVKGEFPFEKSQIDNQSVSMAHLDVDSYDSTMNSLKFLIRKLEIGGVIVLHDYNSIGCPGVKQAVRECLLEERGIFIMEVNECQAVLIRTMLV